MQTEIFTMVVDGVTYFGAVALDGWPTGPCPSASKAVERLAAYERGEEVSEAAPQQCSRRQMTAFAQWCADERLDVEFKLAEDARRDGLHSEAWVRASHRFVALLRMMPDRVKHAGGARLRCAVDEASLSRGS